MFWGVDSPDCFADIADTGLVDTADSDQSAGIGDTGLADTVDSDQPAGIGDTAPAGIGQTEASAGTGPGDTGRVALSGHRVVARMAAGRMTVARIAVGHIVAGRIVVGRIVAGRIGRRTGHIAVRNLAAHRRTARFLKKRGMANRKTRRKSSAARDPHRIGHRLKGTRRVP